MSIEKINIFDEPEKIDLSSKNEKVLLDLQKPEKLLFPEEEIILPKKTENPFVVDEEMIKRIVLANMPKVLKGKK